MIMTNDMSSQVKQYNNNINMTTQSNKNERTTKTIDKT